MNCDRQPGSSGGNNINATESRILNDARSAALRRRREREQQLLESLEEIIVVEGWARCSMSDLAARLRCSKRTLYELANSKEELFLLAFGRSLDRIWQLGLAAEKRARTPQERINEYVLASVVELRRWSAVFLADVQGLPKARRMLDEHLNQRMDYLIHLVDEGIEIGVFRDMNSTLVAELIHASAMHFCSPEFLERASLSLSESIEKMCELVFEGLFVQSPRSLKAQSSVVRRGDRQRRASGKVR